jgi:signal transduction histidine kinase
MSTPLRVLIIEDSEDDMLLQLRELRRGGYEPTHLRVQTGEELSAALHGQEWDLVLSDYVMPRFDGLSALRLVKATGLDLPFILLSGTVGEDIAVESMKAGANDYLLKDSLVRLVPAVRRELSAAVERRRSQDEKRRLEGQLAQAQKLEALGTLAGGIAHDFNNILAGLTGYVEMVRADTKDQPLVQANVQQIVQGIHRAGDLVQRILTFSRKRTVLLRPMHLGPVVQEALALLRPLMPADVEVEVRLSAEQPLVAADAGGIHQVLVNLCNNALQAMSDRPGKLRVELEPVEVDAAFAAAHLPLHGGAHVRLTVSDTGSGMDEQTQAHLFEPFFTTKAPGTGTGLGLVMVKNIVTAHCGAIVVASDVGQGTTFALYFPAAVGQVSSVPSPPTDLAGAGVKRGHGERILFVDDEETLSRMGEAMLGRLGYRVTAYTNPQEALAAFIAEPASFDALVTDLTMPRLKGTELATRIRQVRPDLPVILTTGYSSQVELDRAHALGFQQLLEKPYTAEKIGALLGSVLAKT